MASYDRVQSFVSNFYTIHELRNQTFLLVNSSVSRSCASQCIVLYFPKFMVALNPTYRNFLSFAKSCVLSCMSKVDNIKEKITEPLLNYKPLKL